MVRTQRPTRKSGKDHKSNGSNKDTRSGSSKDTEQRTARTPKREKTGHKGKTQPRMLANLQHTANSVTSQTASVPVGANVAKFYADVCKRQVSSIKDEFTALGKLTPAAFSIDAFGKSPNSNRYRDVMCIDATRVTLTDHSTDYIHANWVTGSEGNKSFICCQGPTDTTMVEFWKMVWQEEVALIMMLCDVVEAGKTKCSQYWPAANTPSIVVGDFTIVRGGPPQLKTLCSGHKAYVSDLEVTMEGCAPRTVKHVHYPDWPDRAVPTEAVALIKLRQWCVEMNEGKPVVVHCSAGIGRTGTLVVIDLCIGMLDRNEPVDVVATVRKVREQRLHSVQTELQYMFIYKALVDYCIANLGVDRKTATAFNKAVTAAK